MLHRWRRELRDYGVKAFIGNGQHRVEECRISELERKVGRKALEKDYTDLLKSRGEPEARPPQAPAASSWGPAECFL